MSSAPADAALAWPTARRWRLASGLVMLAYIATHLFNHALGLWSLGLAEAALDLAKACWQSLPGSLALYGAASLHFMLALYTLFERRHWRLPLIEWVRLWAGFSMPLLLVDHVVGTRVAHSFYGYDPNYVHIIGNIIANKAHNWQIALMAPGWVHGCLGLWITLRRYDTMQRLKPLLIGLVVLLPILSAAGFLVMSSGIDPDLDDYRFPRNPDALVRWHDGLLTGYFVLIVSAAMAGQMRNLLLRRTA